MVVCQLVSLSLMSVAMVMPVGGGGGWRWLTMVVTPIEYEWVTSLVRVRTGLTRVVGNTKYAESHFVILGIDHQTRKWEGAHLSNE